MSDFPDCHVITFVHSEPEVNKTTTKACKDSINSVFSFRLMNFYFLQRYYCSWVVSFRGINFKYFFPFTQLDSLGLSFSLFQNKDFELKTYKLHCCTKFKSTCILTKVSLIKHSNRWICWKLTLSAWAKKKAYTTKMN